MCREFFFRASFFVLVFGQSVLAGEQLFIQPGFEAPAKKSGEIIEGVRSDLSSPGLSIAVGKDGKLVWAQGFGYADVKKKEAVLINTRFRVGSIAKAITSVAIGKLVEEGKLDLDEPIKTYVPYWPKKRHPITVRQLAGHLAGIRHYRGGEYHNTKHYDTVKEAVGVFQNSSLLFRPGTEFNYSSWGYVLISAALEGASGESFVRYMDQEIFKPLGMKDTLADDPRRDDPQLASFYHAYDRRASEVSFVNNSVKIAGGGILSTPRDLVIMSNRLTAGTFLKKETWALLTESQKLEDGSLAKGGYAIGWRKYHLPIKEGGKKVTLINHGGTSVGCISYLTIFPELDVVVAMTTNTEFGSAWRSFSRYTLTIADVFDRL